MYWVLLLFFPFSFSTKALSILRAHWIRIFPCLRVEQPKVPFDQNSNSWTIRKRSQRVLHHLVYSFILCCFLSKILPRVQSKVSEHTRLSKESQNGQQKRSWLERRFGIEGRPRRICRAVWCKRRRKASKQQYPILKAFVSESDAFFETLNWVFSKFFLEFDFNLAILLGIRLQFSISSKNLVSN